MGKSTTSMTIFNSYISLPEGSKWLYNNLKVRLQYGYLQYIMVIASWLLTGQQPYYEPVPHGLWAMGYMHVYIIILNAIQLYISIITYVYIYIQIYYIIYLMSFNYIEV